MLPLTHTILQSQIIKPLSVFHIFRGEKIAENELVGIIYYAKAKTFDIKLSEEHTEFQWVKPSEALDLVPNESMRRDINALLKELENERY